MLRVIRLAGPDPPALSVASHHTPLSGVLKVRHTGTLKTPVVCPPGSLSVTAYLSSRGPGLLKCHTRPGAVFRIGEWRALKEPGP
jgi:hypothetical protein